MDEISPLTNFILILSLVYYTWHRNVLCMYEFMFYPGTITTTNLQNIIDIRDIIICKSHQIYQIDRCDRIFNVRFIVARRI